MRRTKEESRARVVALLGAGLTRNEIAADLGIGPKAAANYISAVRCEVSGAKYFKPAPTLEQDEDGWRRRQACKLHLERLEAVYPHGFGELKFASCDLAQAVANTRRLERGAVNLRFSEFTSTAALFEGAVL